MANVKIKVFVKRPDEKGHMTWMSNSLKALQTAVDGYIEEIRIAPGVMLICNEEGRLRGLEPNCRISGVEFVGTIVIAGDKDGELTDVPLLASTLKLMCEEVRA